MKGSSPVYTGWYKARLKTFVTLVIVSAFENLLCATYTIRRIFLTSRVLPGDGECYLTNVNVFSDVLSDHVID